MSNIPVSVMIEGDSCRPEENAAAGVLTEKGKMTLHTEEITPANLWKVIGEYAGRPFVTKKGLPFTYVVKGGELFTDRRERSITRSTFEKAYEKLCRDRLGETPPQRIVGPKTLNMYGAPYVWAVFVGIGFIGEEEEKENQSDMQQPLQL